MYKRQSKFEQTEAGLNFIEDKLESGVSTEKEDELPIETITCLNKQKRNVDPDTIKYIKEKTETAVKQQQQKVKKEKVVISGEFNFDKKTLLNEELKDWVKNTPAGRKAFEKIAFEHNIVKSKDNSRASISARRKTFTEIPRNVQEWFTLRNELQKAFDFGLERCEHGAIEASEFIKKNKQHIYSRKCEECSNDEKEFYFINTD